MLSKINKAQAILKKRLPERYQFDIKVYESTETMLRNYAKVHPFHKSYKCLIDSLNNKLSNLDRNPYVNTKYFNRRKRNKSKKYTYKNVVGISTNPISLSLETLIDAKLSIQDIIFILLHEIAHIVLDTRIEKRADMFAIRWVRKMIKEKLIA